MKRHMGILRFLSTVLMAGLMIPILGQVLVETLIGLGNGQWLALLDALPSAAHVLPLALLSAPLFCIGAVCVATMSLGLERLLRRRTILVWLFHGTAISLLHTMWVASANLVTTLSLVASWMLTSAGMWFVLSRRHPLRAEMWS